MDLFLCPVCKMPLLREGGSLKCAQGHNFDLASSGYVNLLVDHSKKSSAPGDSKEMCAARNHFLSKDYYRCLAEGLADYVTEVVGDNLRPVVIDAACGEGYYTAALYDHLAEAGKAPRVAGVDIAKYALKYAAKRRKQISFAAASIFNLPLESEVADVVTNLFAPVADAEFRRVLKPGGRMVVVGPGERHLWELKQFLYESPYLNEPKHYSFEGFALERKLHFGDRIRLTSSEDIRNLFSMTPYYWKTSAEAAERLYSLPQIELEISFELQSFIKKS